jgi:hypothetical protein
MPMMEEPDQLPERQPAEWMETQDSADLREMQNLTTSLNIIMGGTIEIKLEYLETAKSEIERAKRKYLNSNNSEIEPITQSLLRKTITKFEGELPRLSLLAKE